MKTEITPEAPDLGLVADLVQVMNAEYDGIGRLPAHVLGILNTAVERLAAREVASSARGQEPLAWTKEKPTVEGAYGVRGWNLDPGCSADNALVTVAMIDCELCSDLSECNTGRARDWLPIEQHSDSFEWMGPLYAAPPELLAAQPDRAAEYDDAGSATPTDAEILSSLRGLYASDAAAAMAAEDDVRTVRAFLARRKNYAFPPAPAAVPVDNDEVTESPATTAAARANFEAWCEGLAYSKATAQNNCGITVPGRYAHSKVQIAWEAWQAALASQPQAPAAPVD